MIIVGPPNKEHTWEPVFLSFVERLSSFGGYFVWSVNTFRLSVVERFVLFQSVLHWRFLCKRIHSPKGDEVLVSSSGGVNRSISFFFDVVLSYRTK